MGLIRKTSPTVIRLEGFEKSTLKRVLTYKDKSVEYQYNKLRNSKWMLEKLGETEWRSQLEELKGQREMCLLFEDASGLWTYSGLAGELTQFFSTSTYIDEVEYPEYGIIGWDRKPDKSPFQHQSAIVDELLKVRHGAVEAATGTGKSFALLNLVRTVGLKTVVMTPSISIAEQLYDEFRLALGKGAVGRFFGTKKKVSDKVITIAVDDSLASLEPSSEHWKNLSSAKVFCADESHLCPAKTLAEVCFGLMKDAPYRFFVSATQVRNDGKDMLLRAIIGPVVYRLPLREAVERGILARPMFRVVKYTPDDNYWTKDVIRLQRHHLFYAKAPNKLAGEMANSFVDSGRPTLILIRDVEQFSHVLPYLRHRALFAHGPLTKENKATVPEEYQDSDVSECVAAFNEGRVQVLVGTSAICTGTDVRPAGAVINLRGGTSPIDVPQCVGRGTRRPNGKADFFYVDFRCEGVEALERHSDMRLDIYRDLYPDIEVFAP